MAFAAPAMAPASAVSFKESWGNGDMILRDIPYEAKRRELTPAMPMRGLAIPFRWLEWISSPDNWTWQTFVQRKEPFLPKCLGEDIHRSFLRGR